MEQTAEHGVLEVPEAQADTAQVRETSVDRLDRIIQRASKLEERERLSPFGS
ncbi:MAG: hypothetical protein ACTHZ9_11645 [Leucobacter sp.]